MLATQLYRETAGFHILRMFHPRNESPEQTALLMENSYERERHNNIPDYVHLDVCKKERR